MKIRLLPFLLSSAVLAAFCPALKAQPAENAPPAKAEKAGKKKEDETELEGKMDKLNGAFKKLRKQAGDAASNASSLELVATMKKNALAAVKLIPAKAADVPEADRPKFVAAYQDKMKSFLEAIDKLEAAFKADKNDEATKIVGELAALQKESHKEFRRPQS